MTNKYSYSRGEDAYFYFWHLIKDGIIVGELYLSESTVKELVLDLNMACNHDWRDGDPWGRGNSDNYVCGNCGASVNKKELDVDKKEK